LLSIGADQSHFGCVDPPVDPNVFTSDCRDVNNPPNQPN
jgi:hypothetical protein